MMLLSSLLVRECMMAHWLCTALHQAAARGCHRRRALRAAQAVRSTARAHACCAVAVRVQCSVSAPGSERGEQAGRGMSERCGQMESGQDPELEQLRRWKVRTPEPQ